MTTEQIEFEHQRRMRALDAHFARQRKQMAKLESEMDEILASDNIDMDRLLEVSNQLVALC